MAGPGVLVVTGGGRGIGAAVAGLAAARGWAVCLCYREQAQAAERVVARIAELGGSARALRADVALEADARKLFEAAAELGPLAGLVNNAGVSGGRATLAELEPASFDLVLGVNLRGAFLCAREAVRRMARSRGGAGGAIVNVSSTAAVTGGERLLAYAASKAALETFTLGLAREVAPEGIRVNAVRPGIIETEGQTRDAPADPERARARVARIPLGRAGAPADVAGAVVWLLSPEASYVTGSVLPVTGGL
jgi:NAD(P)-dependent dehydrogenase (short-subunit alcohol dehydrogenase family)